MRFSLVALLCVVMFPTLTRAQDHIQSRADIQWDRYYTYAEMERHLERIAQAYPDIVELRSIGKSLQGRDLWVAIITGPDVASHKDKPAIWIDGNVHGNEIQAGEVVLYTLWYLAKAYGNNQRLTRILDETTFYLLVSQNPDGREYWFREANTPHSSRHSQRAIDNDRDGLLDEDPPEDLDNDGSITSMWKVDPSGTWVRDQYDDRIFRRLNSEQLLKLNTAATRYINLGQEGIDNDGDGQTNEDGPFGDDMNRNWPGDWQPSFVQYGAGEYPFSAPETRAIGDFILDHPNIAAAQSYHNSGGMILRGPGASYRENMYPGADRRVYDELAKTGEEMLPYYRDMTIYKDLYTVHGGFVNWVGESLGCFSFTNEMWSAGKYFQRDGAGPNEQRQWLWRDLMVFGQIFTPYTEVDHPEHGTVLVGGLNKWSSRNTPTFMLEEECHRNFAFTVYHADQMARLRFGRTDIKQRSPGLFELTVEVRNDKLIPTRSALQRQKSIGTNDLLLIEAGGAEAVTVVAAGTLGSWQDQRFDPIVNEPDRIQVRAGIAGRSGTIFRFIIRAAPGSQVALRYQAERATNIETTVILQEAD